MSQINQENIFFNCEQCKQKARLDQQYYIENKELNTIDFVCYFCYDDSIVKVWDYTLGDYNDIFSRDIIKGNGKQVREYCLSQFDGFEDRKDEIEDIETDAIGFEIYYPEEIDPETNEPYEDQESRIELFNEAREIEDFSQLNRGYVDIDLTENNEDSV
jgi:hypothetical protein